jgi:hypothetical protein
VPLMTLSIALHIVTNSLYSLIDMPRVTLEAHSSSSHQRSAWPPNLVRSPSGVPLASAFLATAACPRYSAFLLAPSVKGPR